MVCTLTPLNTAALAHYAELVGVSPEPFLLSFTIKDRAKAERMANWVKKRLTFPNSRNTLEVEVLELPQGNFKVRAAWIGDGRTDVISC